MSKELSPIETARDLATKVASQNSQFLSFDQKSFMQASVREGLSLLKKGVHQAEIGRALRQCAQHSMLPGSHIYLIPFRNKFAEHGSHTITLLMSYRGVLEKINALDNCYCSAPQVVRDDEVFSLSRAVENGEIVFNMKHDLNPSSKGEIIGVYCLIKRDGDPDIIYLERDYIMKVREFAIKKSRDRETPWKGPFEIEMWKKTAVLRAAKYFPFGLPDIEGLELGSDEPTQITSVEADYAEAPSLPPKAKEQPEQEPIALPPAPDEAESYERAEAYEREEAEAKPPAKKVKSLKRDY